MENLPKQPQKIKRPALAAGFKEYINYYMVRKRWNQNRLAECARLNQPQLNKMINGKVYNMSIDTLACLCLALQLTLPEAEDLLARAERAFSPASELHTAYKELINQYAVMPFERINDEKMLDEADRFLQVNGLQTLPNCYSY